jgi:hypothetical protein
MSSSGARSADYHEKLRLLIIDRLVIGLFLVAVGFFVSAKLDAMKTMRALNWTESKSTARPFSGSWMNCIFRCSCTSSSILS